MRYDSPEYKNYINSQRWKDKCELYWLAKGRWCRACVTKTGPLHIHHLTYEHLGFEPLRDLIGLCYACHRQVHALHRRGGRRETIRVVTLRFIREKQLDRLRKRR